MLFRLSHMYTCNDSGHKAHTPNCTYKKLAVQWLNEALCFVSSMVVADIFVLRNRQLHIFPNIKHFKIDSISLKRSHNVITL
jgi:hypothetical protein